MKTVVYAPEALKALKRHANVAPRIRRAIENYAAGTGAHSNNVIRLANSTLSRLRIGDFRVIFFETETSMEVLKIAPRDGAYD